VRFPLPIWLLYRTEQDELIARRLWLVRRVGLPARMGILDMSRRVAFDIVGAYEVSTVNLDTQVTMLSGERVGDEWETVVFKGKSADAVVRASYESREDAIAGHARMVERVQRELP
jgi:hypothetical protein